MSEYKCQRFLFEPDETKLKQVVERAHETAKRNGQVCTLAMGEKAVKACEGLTKVVKDVPMTLDKFLKTNEDDMTGWRLIVITDTNAIQLVKAYMHYYEMQCYWAPEKGPMMVVGMKDFTRI